MMEYHLTVKRNELQSHEKAQNFKMHIAKWNKPIWNDYILYYSSYMTFWKRQNYGEKKKGQWLPGICGKVEHTEFLGQLDYSVWFYRVGYASSYICQNP